MSLPTMRVITVRDVRASVRRARASLEKAADEIVWQIEVEAWKTLSYSSWDAMREAEYGGAAFMVPRRQRRELVQRMRRTGMTQQDIASTAGVSHATVQEDLKADICNDDEPLTITNARGQQRPASYATREADAESTRDPVMVTCPTCGGTGEVAR